jgi:hypothetical protein
MQDHLLGKRHNFAPNAPFVWHANALPAWLWLGLPNHLTTALESPPLIEWLHGMLQTHLPAIWAKWLTLREPQKEISAVYKELARLARDEAPLETLGEVASRLAEVVDAPLPLASFLLKSDIPWCGASSRDRRGRCPGGVLVVERLGLEAAVEDAHQAVGKLA